MGNQSSGPIINIPASSPPPPPPPPSANLPSIENTNQINVLKCPIGFKLNYHSNSGIVSCKSIPSGFTSIIYEFKSRKNFNVENFSQNTNGKCKARY